MTADSTSLDRLNDVIVPSPSPWWPPAPGWYWLLAAVILGLIFLALHEIRHWLRNRYRQEALAELERLEAEAEDPKRRGAALASLAILLKRTALSAWPREAVAGLTGPEWMAHLDHSGNSTFFSKSDGKWIERAAYDPASIQSLDEDKALEIFEEAHHWITQHHVSKIKPRDR